MPDPQIIGRIGGARGPPKCRTQGCRSLASCIDAAGVERCVECARKTGRFTLNMKVYPFGSQHRGEDHADRNLSAMPFPRHYES